MSWLSGYRRLSPRYERHSRNYLAFLGLAAALCCYKRLVRLTAYVGHGLTAIPLEAINDVCLRRDDLLQKPGELELQLFHRVGVIVIGGHPVQQFVDLLLQRHHGSSATTIACDP